MFKKIFKKAFKDVFINSRQNFKNNHKIDLMVCGTRAGIMISTVSLTNDLFKKLPVIKYLLVLIETIAGILWIAH